jgi:hypothetical protein
MAHYCIDDFREAGDGDDREAAAKSEAESIQPGGDRPTTLPNSDERSQTNNEQQGDTGGDAAGSSDVSPEATPEDGGDSGLGGSSGEGGDQAGAKPKK